MYIIDFHSHILPGIDDGARNMNSAMSMLEQVREQKVDYMVATPHFYASQDRIETFLQRRENAWDAFWSAIQEKGYQKQPHIILGSEVAFFDGISRAEDIPELTMRDTNILLVEMPFVPWTDRNIDEIHYLIKERNLRVLIAHLERFIWMPGNKKMVSKLLELPVSVQVNAESLTDWRHRRALVKMFSKGTAHVLGSDCHGSRHRIPNLQTGREIILKKAGAECLEKIDQYGQKLLLGD